MAADGSIVIESKLDNAQAEKELDRLTKRIENIEKEISGKQAEKSQWVQSAEELGVQLDSAKAKLYEMQTAAKGVFSAEQISMQKETVNSLQYQWNAAESQVEKYDRQIQSATTKLNQNKEQAAELADQIAKAAKNQNKFDGALDDTSKRFDKLLSRVSRLASRVFLFSMITTGLRAIRDWMGDVVTSNDEASAALARLKGALLTMVQPLVSVVIPAFTTLVNLLTAIVGKVAAFISALGGKTVQQSADAAKALNKQANAIGGVGSAAKEAEKQLMGFDEINKLSSETPSAGGVGGGTGATDIQPDFSWADGVSETLDRIADLVLLIGAGLALWKIGQLIPGTLGVILSKLGLIMAAVGGLLLMWDGMNDAWENGVDWINMTEMIAGLAVAAGALYLAFGPLAAGITLIVGGLALLVTAFNDVMNNGFNLQNTLLAIAGIMAAGLGITLLTGSFIPLLIAAIASLLLAFTVATGHGEELIDGLKKVCQGFLDFFTGLFSGDMDKALSGLKTMFSGFGEIGQAVLSGLMDAMGAFLSWLNEKTGGAVNGVIGIINRMIAAVVNGINALFSLLSFNINLPGGNSIGLSLPQFDIPQIPYLAQGAVIPPNREFMAVLGDQKSGNNIEAPEDLIRKIVREETANMGGGDITINFTGDLAQLARILYPEIHRQDRNTARARGW